MPSNLRHVRPETIQLKGHPDLSERWLQDRIAEDPSILNLGDLEVIARERRQERAGRLDLLLGDPEQNRRFEVELMLGATDESHIIRCIEYWDIERRRFPAYEHCAVLVAEDITSRFLNVLALFAGTIPLVVIQLSALKLGDQILLHFVKVLDQRMLRRDDTTPTESPQADRGYWVAKASAESVELVEQLVPLVNEVARDNYRPNFNRHYVGLADNNVSRNFIIFWPRKKHVVMRLLVEDAASFIPKFEEVGIEARVVDERLRLSLNKDSVSRHRGLLADVLRAAVEEFQK
jgi:hypothetical protein